MGVGWVGQDDQQGCSVAVLAMMTGRPYAEVKAAVGFDGSLKSSCPATQKRWLKSLGYESEICYSRKSGFDRRSDFIPTDRPYFLWLSVGSNTWGHSVLQLMDGTVLDPEHQQPRRLEDLPEVQMISVVVPPFDRHTG